MNIYCYRRCTLARLVTLLLSRAPLDVDTAFSRSFTLGSQHRTGHKAYGKAFS